MRTPNPLRLAGLLGALAAWQAAPLAADDRNLLRTSGGDPYVMILFDTSGSMNWAPKCTQEQVDAGICNYLCPTGDCPVPRDGDDPASKFRQAKEALYEVVQTVDNVYFGFSSFNQDGLHVNYKHWLYRVSATQPNGLPTLVSGSTFPTVGADWVFGATFDCDRGTGDSEKGCYANGDDQADTDDSWEMTRIARWPKGGSTGTIGREFWIRDQGRVYHVFVDDPGSAIPYGAGSIAAHVHLSLCTGSPADNPSNACNASNERTLLYDDDVRFDLVGDFVMWDFTTSRDLEQGGYFGITYSDTTGNNNTCEGWDPNSDTFFGNTNTTDDYYRDDNGNLYSLKQPNEDLTDGRNTTDDPWRFFYGDVIPLDWKHKNKDRLLARLAPRLGGNDPDTDPEAFAVATYLADARQSDDQFLRAKNEAQKPLFPNGSTPLGYSLKSLREWFRGCENGSCPQDTGWDDVAAVSDPQWECRKKFLIVLTDGDDTCPGRDPCSLTASMHALDDITTYVVAFGVENTAQNRLNCMAANGGSGDPIYPQNKQELVDALTSIFGEIQEQAAAFASAAVPTVQANVADKIYLSSFTPLNNESIWPGRIDAFLKPLPLDEAGLPDRTQACGVSGTSDCWLWDAGDSQLAWNGEAGYAPVGLLTQAPLAEDIVDGDNSTLKIGLGQNERRVFFGLPNDSAVAGKRQYFQFPAVEAEQNEFEWAWNLSPDAADDAANLITITANVKFTLQQKQGIIDDPVTGAETHVQYLMGDIFHADPGLLDQPENFDFYTKDPYRNTALCGQSIEQTNQRNPPVSYRYFADRHACRRKILFAASNDGQLHAFDSGIFEGTDCKFPVTEDRDSDGQPDGDGDPIDGSFDNGTGKEIFSFIPATMMPVVRELVTETNLADSGIWGVDGTVRIADVFIDPAPTAGVPTCTDRQWRTILIGGYREGGPGYYALDITQPDLIDDATNVPAPLGGDAGYVPSCTEGANGCGPLPFPAKLWEFQDLTDEDGSSAADLGESWSRPVIERLRVCTADCGTDVQQLEDRFVAIFGGGLPTSPAHGVSDTVGNWLYMVDVETGEILYKRGGVARVGATDSIVGAVPADIATVDFNGNGYIDTIYFGTTAGYLYKVDLGEGPFELDIEGRIADPDGEEGRYDPFQVFWTEGRPIYFEPTAIYLPKLRALGIAFGTGDRWDLWSFNGQEGRFYVIADLNWTDANRDGVVDSVCGGCPQPLTESVYQAIGLDDAFDPLAPPPDYLLDTSDSTPGWFIRLTADDRVITEAFSLSGVTIFTAYAPRQTEEEGVCALGGESKIFVVGTANAIGYARAAGSTTRTRYTTAPTFTTAPFVEQSSTQNEPHGPGGDPDAGPPLCGTAELLQVREELKGLFPPSCRFAFYNKNIETVRSDTGLICIAPVPVCIEQHNWKEF